MTCVGLVPKFWLIKKITLSISYPPVIISILPTCSSKVAPNLLLHRLITVQAMQKKMSGIQFLVIFRMGTNISLL